MVGLANRLDSFTLEIVYWQRVANFFLAMRRTMTTETTTEHLFLKLRSFLTEVFYGFLVMKISH